MIKVDLTLSFKCPQGSSEIIECRFQTHSFVATVFLGARIEIRLGSPKQPYFFEVTHVGVIQVGNLNQVVEIICAPQGKNLVYLEKILTELRKAKEWKEIK